MCTEDWILKGIELITNTKKQRLKAAREKTTNNTQGDPHKDNS